MFQRSINSRCLKMGLMGLCSVLIPAYNAETYLRRALDSVLDQTYKEFEIILINDGSTDSTALICNEYAEKYDFIHVLHQENMGAYRTRKKLLEKASGKYIFWLDADDYYECTLLEKAMNAFETSEADIVVWGRVELNTRERRNSINPIEELGISKWREWTNWGIHVEMPMYASKKCLWNNLDMPRNGEDLTDDVWFSSQVIQKAKNIVSLGECHYFYDRTNMMSDTHTYSGERIFRDGITFYKVLKRNLAKNPKDMPLSLQQTRKLLVNAYCVNLVNPSLEQAQVDYIRLALDDLRAKFPQKKMKKFYFIQLCVHYGIDFICRQYGKGRIKSFKRDNL